MINNMAKYALLSASTKCNDILENAGTNIIAMIHLIFSLGRLNFV